MSAASSFAGTFPLGPFAPSQYQPGPPDLPNRRVTPRMSRMRPYLLSLAFALPVALQGQQAATPTARLRGTVTDASTARPIIGVRVVLASTGRFVLTDTVGGFEITQLPSGVLRFFFSAEGFPRTSVALAFAPGEHMVQAFEMDSSAATIAADTAGPRRAQMLPTEEIRAAASRGVRYEDFERRLKTGRGQYRTREEIEEAGYRTLSDAVRGMRGVQVDCAGLQGCFVRMARAPMRCMPKYIVDGREDPFFGPFVPVGDIEGIEVYTGAADVPGEYAGSDAMCGVVVVWTKSAPSPPKRP
jgi:hypothetical protein